jgi:hypothetical protein
MLIAARGTLLRFSLDRSRSECQQLIISILFPAQSSIPLGIKFINQIYGFQLPRRWH